MAQPPMPNSKVCPSREPYAAPSLDCSMPLPLELPEPEPEPEPEPLDPPLVPFELPDPPVVLFVDMPVVWFFGSTTDS